LATSLSEIVMLSSRLGIEWSGLSGPLQLRVARAKGALL
jgi:hypothetical protein